ncbi:GTP cyclohydrolase I [Rhizobium sp. BK060]|uniref:GTP cyclohydrolase I n=1 Tax=Rhizobium sp. BK060 TaxID=2587096 RepID=UPI00160B0FC5|nr:GTP cyclohydrolase I [Rhizobium sp. BK060]MBB3399368.1 hypothetical protein [Rhizobium sp. BK060]
MDAIVEGSSVSPDSEPTKEEAEAAVRTLIRWAADDPGREGLIDTPPRVVRAYKALFSGYSVPIRNLMSRTFSDVGGYDDLVVIRDIGFFSHCEYHRVIDGGKLKCDSDRHEQIMVFAGAAVDRFERTLNAGVYGWSRQLETTWPTLPSIYISGRHPMAARLRSCWRSSMSPIG